MQTAPYLWMHIITLICNLLLYISYYSVKGEHTVDAFKGLLALFILYPAASICQRLYLWPNAVFWFKLSQCVLMLMPFSIYYFLSSYVCRKISVKEYIFYISLTLLLVVPSIFDVYLERPDLLISNGNAVRIVYNGDWKIIIPVFIILIFLTGIIRIVEQNWKEKEFLYINIGLIALIIGNVMLVVPGNSFPWDMVGCLVNAIMLALALRKLHLLNFRIYLSFETLVLMAALTTGLSGIAIFDILSADKIVSRYYKNLMELWIASTCCTMVAAYIYSFISRRTSLVNSEHLLDVRRKYSEEMMADMANTEQIISNLREILYVVLGEYDAVIYRYDKKNMCYTAYGKEHGSISFPDISEFSKLSSWLAKDQRVDYSSSMLWTLDKSTEALKYEINQRKLTYIVPFTSDNEILGFMLFGIHGGHRIRTSVLHTIDSIIITTSLAMKTQQIYMQLKEKLTEDSGTGLLKREYFDDYLNKCIEEEKRMVLYIPDLDDMKLFNQVYGNVQGDAVVRVFARILSSIAPENSRVCRYEGKTFCVVFDGDLEKGEDFDVAFRKEWYKHTSGTFEERVHFSSGLMIVEPGVAHDSIEAVTLCKLAVKKAKRHGKNHLCVFREAFIDDENLWETGFNVTTTEAISRAIDLKDNFTYQHSCNVAKYARELAIDIGLSYYDQQLIYEAGLVHDVGKLAIPDRILTKPGKLTDEEYAIMKTHVLNGHDIISASTHGNLLVPLAETHHERWDGRGYPRGIKGTDIPIGGRCLAIADAYDAMTGRRIYKNAMTPEAAVEELRRCKGTQFDPDLTDRFIHLVEQGRIKPTIKPTVSFY